MEQYNNNWTSKVSKAFYDYGRLCAAHRGFFLLLACLTTLFLTLPAVGRIHLASSSPIEVYYQQQQQQQKSTTRKDMGPSNIIDASAAESVAQGGGVGGGNHKPDWFLVHPPKVYIQHILLRIQQRQINDGSDDSFHPNDQHTNAEDMLDKAAILEAFRVVDAITGASGHLSTGASKEHVNENKQKSGAVESNCFRPAVNPFSANNRELLPLAHSCAILSPANFWQNNILSFLEDESVLETIQRGSVCSNSLCPQNILFGVSPTLTGIPVAKTITSKITNVSVSYAVTLLLLKPIPSKLRSLLQLSARYQLVEVRDNGNSQLLVHIFYKPHKFFSDYINILVSYFLCALYFYYTVKKVQMVHNKWKLAIVAFVNVLATLSTTYGICSYFELTPTLWGAALYPYLAMVVGLENTMCITRSVVWVSPLLDVSSRISQGLSEEGPSILKYFLVENLFLLFGWLTNVPQLQEFCVFAFVGLAVDFYMQMFFFAPCLVLDLENLLLDEKRKFSTFLFRNWDTQPIESNFNPLKCPAERLFPVYFNNMKSIRNQKQSQKSILESKDEPKKQSKDEAHQKPSNRLRLLYYWTKTRFLQRSLLVFFFLWAVWIGFIAHQHKYVDLLNYSTIFSRHDEETLSNEGDNKIDPSTGEWNRWHQQWLQMSFRWWPAFFAEYNLSISGNYITFLPPLLVKRTLDSSDYDFTGLRRRLSSLEDETLYSTENPNSANDKDIKTHELNTRIDWLERQITTLLICSVLMPFSIVITFILYACFRGNKRQKRKNASRNASKSNNTIGILPEEGKSRKTSLESSVLLVARTDLPIECFVTDKKSNIIAAALAGGRVLIWSLKTGMLKHTLHRLPQQSFEPMKTTPKIAKSAEQRTRIWCMANRENLVLFGCSTGALEIFDLEVGKMLGFCDMRSGFGVTHLHIIDSNVVIARIDGHLELFELQFDQLAVKNSKTQLDLSSSFSEPTLNKEIKQIAQTKAFKGPVVRMECSAKHVVTTSCESASSIKVYSTVDLSLLYVLRGGHDSNSFIAGLYLDKHIQNTLFSVCELGSVIKWNLSTGELEQKLRTQQNVLKTSGKCLTEVGLASTSKLLFVEERNGAINVWNKEDNQFLVQLSVDEIGEKNASDEDEINEIFHCGGTHILTIGEDLIVTSLGKTLRFWDLQKLSCTGQVCLPTPIEAILQFEDVTLICNTSTEIYLITIKNNNASN